MDRCLFDGCFASNKGGGVHVANGKFSMLKSTFVNNTAGSDNVESGQAQLMHRDVTVLLLAFWSCGPVLCSTLELAKCSTSKPCLNDN